MSTHTNKVQLSALHTSPAALRYAATPRISHQELKFATAEKQTSVPE